VITPTLGAVLGIARQRGLCVAATIVVAATFVAAAADGRTRAGGRGPISTARVYAHAVLGFDGKPFTADGNAICRFFTAHLRQVYDEQAVEQEGAGVHASCGFLLHGEIGYPHENAKSDFVGGRLLQVGAERRVVRQGVHYIGVRLRARIEGEWSGYAVGHRSGERFSRTIDDIVWLPSCPTVAGRFRNRRSSSTPRSPPIF